MNSRQPPKLAVWLLNRLGVSAHNEPLSGDLLEEFRSGRTAAWYWRQALMAILHRVRSCQSDLRELIIGCTAESSVPLALWILHVPVGLRGLVLGFSALASIWIVIYVEYRVRLHLWMNDDSSEEESDERWDRDLSPRLGVLRCFGYFVFSDALVAPNWLVPWLRGSLPLLLALHVCWLSYAFVRTLQDS